MEIDVKDAKCTGLSFSAPVLLATSENASGFEIEAYTGAVVDRWWGKLAIDVSGIKAKQKIPIFRLHKQGDIIGYSKKTWKDSSFRVSGVFSDATPAAKEAKALAAEGFPWQASIGVRPLKILSLEDNKATHEVNGMKLSGPAEIWTESEVFEVSFVPLGADDGTSVATFSKFTEASPQGEIINKADKGAKPMPITIESLSAENPALLAEIQTAARAEGAKAERERIEGVLGQALPGHEPLVQRLAFDGSTTPDQAAVAVLAAEKALRAAKREEFAADAIAPVAAPAAPTAPPKPADPTTREEFEKDSALVQEFGDFDTYNAYLKATSAGLVRIMKKGA